MQGGGVEWSQIIIGVVPSILTAILGGYLRGQFLTLKEELLKEVRENFVTSKEFDRTVNSLDKEMDGLRAEIREKHS